jgi:hypothetical protein
MNLNNWLELSKVSKRQLSTMMHLTPTTVVRWVKLDRFPKVQELIKLERITKGAVTANDFVEQWKEKNDLNRDQNKDESEIKY